jgi:hypothetical protein
MPERTRYNDIAPWLAIAVILPLIAFTAYFVFYSKGYQAADKRHEAENAARYAAEQHYQKCIAKATVKEAVECYKNAETISDEARRSEQDLNAQREMADWAESMLWATLLVGFTTILITGLGVIYVRNTLFETRRIGRAQVTAYLSVPRAEFYIEDMFLHIRAIIRNDGQSPARSVKLSHDCDRVCRKCTVRS